MFSNAAPELVQQIRGGSHYAFELFYRMEFLNLVHFCDSYLHDREKARDLAQDSLLELWNRRQDLDPQRNIRALAFTIARNKTLNELRGCRSMVSSEDIELLEDPSVEAYIGHLELSTLLSKVWDTLPEKAQRAFRLSREQGLRHQDIARLEGVSQKTVEYRIQTVLDRVRKAMKKF